MKILAVTDYIRSPCWNGSEVFCSELLRALRKSHDIDVICRVDVNTQQEEVRWTISDEVLHSPDTLACFTNESIDVSEYDLVYNLGALTFGCAVVSYLQPWCAGVPLVNHFQLLIGPHASIERMTPEQQLGRADGQMLVCEHATLNVFASQGELQAATQFGYDVTSAPVAVVPNGLPVHEFEDITPAGSSFPVNFNGSPRPIVISTAGRFADHSKGADLVYRAFARLYDERQDVFLLSITNSSRYSEVLRGLPKECYRIIDWLPRKRFLQTLAASDIVVVPSRYEPFGLVALEALLLGVPVIANAVGGLAEIIHHDRHGQLNPVSNGSLGLSLSMRHVVDDLDTARRMAIDGQEHARSQFSLSRVHQLVDQQLQRATLSRNLLESPSVFASGKK